MKKTLTTLLILCAIWSVNAQNIDVFDTETGTHEEVTYFSPYLMSGKLRANTFVSVGVGFNFYFGEDNGEASFGKRVGPAWELSVGKWATPFLGVRLQYAGSGARGMTAGGTYRYGSAENGFYREKFTISNFRGDLMFNARNLLDGYGEMRLWDPVPYIGFGIGRSAAGGEHTTELNINIGLLNFFRLTERIDLMAEGRYMIVKSRFDGAPEINKADGQLVFTFGVSFKLFEQGFRRPIKLLPY